MTFAKTAIRVQFIPGPTGQQGDRGDTGPAGTAPEFLTGTGVPSDGDGNNGDYYFNTENGDMYGPKTAGSWGSVTMNITGPPGEQGETGETGAAGADGVVAAFVAGNITNLAYGEPPTADVVEIEANVYRIDLGIPAGQQGEQGVPGNVEGVTGNIVDNADPANPIANQVQTDFDSTEGLSAIANLPSSRFTGTFTTETHTVTVVSGIIISVVAL